MQNDCVTKAQYDRLLELLSILIQNEICMQDSTKVLQYLFDIGFTKDEIRMLNLFSQATIDKIYK